MGYWVKSDFANIYTAGGDPYYEGDQANWQDIAVPQRPSHNARWDGSTWQAKPGQFYDWDTTNLVWVAMSASEIDAIKQQEAQQHWDAVKAFALVMLDRVNATNAALNATNSAVNAATAGTANATNLKTDYPQYTVTQMINAVKAKL